MTMICRYVSLTHGTASSNGKKTYYYEGESDENMYVYGYLESSRYRIENFYNYMEVKSIRNRNHCTCR